MCKSWNDILISLWFAGYQKRWFVLANGLLSYYRNQAEMAHTCRGTISLHGAHIHTEDSCNFIVSNGGGTQTFHLRASSEVERQRWVTALELAKAKAIQRMESEVSKTWNTIIFVIWALLNLTTKQGVGIFWVNSFADWVYLTTKFVD